MEPVKILALDFATRTGWAYDRGDGRPLYGVWDLGVLAGSSHRGALYAALAQRIFTAHKQGGIDLLAYERAFGKVARHGIDMHFEMQGVVLTVAHEIGCRLVSYAPSNLKKRAVGYGNATKAEMMAGIHRYLGLPVTDDNAADAIWIWYFARREPRCASE